MRGEGGVAGEGRVVGVPKFHPWGKCTIPLCVSRCTISLLLYLSGCYIYIQHSDVSEFKIGTVGHKLFLLMVVKFSSPTG